MKRLYTLYDQKAGAFLAPMTFPTDEVAIRSLYQESHKSQSPIFQFPEDFHLICVAAWNEDEGTVIPLPMTESLGTVQFIIDTQKRATSKAAQDREAGSLEPANLKTA